MEMNESYNYPLIIYDNIDGDGDHTSFFLGAKKVSAKKFKLLVKLCAMQFQELGIGPNSIVAFNIKNPMMSHALRLACGLNLSLIHI